MRTTWTPENPGRHPWTRDTYSPLRKIPGGENWLRIRIDPAHTYAIQGWGSTLATSSLILLCQLGLAVGRSINRRLDYLFRSFKQWCCNNRKTTSLSCITLEKLKMKSMLDLIRVCLEYVYIGANRLARG